jgi:predicted Zn-dependent peptidase
MWGDANVVNKIPGWFVGVTSDDIKRTAATYLTPANRTVIDRKPVAKVAAITPPAGDKK